MVERGKGEREREAREREIERKRERESERERERERERGRERERERQRERERDRDRSHTVLSRFVCLLPLRLSLYPDGDHAAIERRSLQFWRPTRWSGIEVSVPTP